MTIVIISCGGVALYEGLWPTDIESILVLIINLSIN